MILINNRKHEWHQGLTVQSLLKEMRYTYPDIIVKINGKFIPKKDYAETEISDGDEVLALHMFGGG